MVGIAETWESTEDRQFTFTTIIAQQNQTAGSEVHRADHFAARAAQNTRHQHQAIFGNHRLRHVAWTGADQIIWIHGQQTAISKTREHTAGVAFGVFQYDRKFAVRAGRLITPRADFQHAALFDQLAQRHGQFTAMRVAAHRGSQLRGRSAGR